MKQRYVSAIIAKKRMIVTISSVSIVVIASLQKRNEKKLEKKLEVFVNANVISVVIKMTVMMNFV
jgi:hypothetical protein